MKKILASLAAAFVTAGAAAAPATPLPAGPIYLKFTGQEQIAINGAHTWTDNKEINWGVFIVDTMKIGKVNEPNDSIDPITTAPNFFSNLDGGQITGMFYGIEQGGASPTNVFPATKGYMDLYWRDTAKLSATDLASTVDGVRCGYSCANGYTQGELLARLYFDTGADSGNLNNTIVGSIVPAAIKNLRGFADSYASVDMNTKGLWSDQLNSNWFYTDAGDRDLRFKNSYNYNAKWNGGDNILGFRVDDPGQAVALPEPGALSLMGLAMIGMGAALRRRRG